MGALFMQKHSRLKTIKIKRAENANAKRKSSRSKCHLNLTMKYLKDQTFPILYVSLTLIICFRL